jgi:hypothetical protein
MHTIRYSHAEWMYVAHATHACQQQTANVICKGTSVKHGFVHLSVCTTRCMHCIPVAWPACVHHARSIMYRLLAWSLHLCNLIWCGLCAPLFQPARGMCAFVVQVIIWHVCNLYAVCVSLIGSMCAACAGHSWDNIQYVCDMPAIWLNAAHVLQHGACRGHASKAGGWKKRILTL